MKRLLALGLGLALTAHADVTLFVSPEGSGDRSGRSETDALPGLEAARDAARKAAAEKNAVVVTLLPGVYALDDSVTFGPADSGAEGRPVIYRAKERGTAVLSGARRFALSDFQPAAKSPMAGRLDPAAREHVLMLDLAKAGVDHQGPFPDRFDDRGGIFEVFDRDGRLPLARWPNEGTTTMGKVLEIGDKNVPGVFEYRDDRPARWAENDNVWLKGQWRVGWEDPAIKVASIDPERKVITFAAGISNGIGSKYHRPNGSGQEPWYAINLPEEIDRPGEWAIDFATNTLFVWPRSADSELLITQMDKPLIMVDGASDLAFENLVLEYSLGDGIVLENVTRCLVAGCVVRNLAGRGIVVNGEKSGILSNDVHDVGEGAVYISGGDRRTLRMSGNYVLNNHLHHYGLLKRQYSAGVHVGVMKNPAGGGAVRDAVGIRVAHNVIHHAPRDAFLYSGNDNVYEFNEVYYCGFDTKDTGAFYSWLDWTMRGNTIRYNFIHNTIGGVNPDDGASGNLVHGNVFAGPRIGVWIASGPDNVIRHNVFVKDEGSVFGMDDRGVGRGYATNPRLISRVNEINPSEDPWLTAHPRVNGMLENRPELPWRTEFVGNLIVSKNPKPSELKMKPEFRTNVEILREEGNVTVAEDPGFRNPAGFDYTLAADAPVLQQIPGFPVIPFEKIGLYLDAYRTELPTEAQRQRSPQDSPYVEDKDKNFGT